MPILVFSDANSLRLTLSSGCVPAGISRRPAQAEIDPRGRIWLEVDLPLSREFAHTLGRFGVQLLGHAGQQLPLAVDCWHQLLALTPAETAAPAERPVLFEVPAADFPSFARELLRLGPGVPQWCWSHSPLSGDCVLVRVVNPPTFSLMSALADTPSRIYAYYEQARGVWVQVGWRHPLAEQIQLPEGEVLFLRWPRIWDYRLPPNFSVGPSEFPLGYQPPTTTTTTTAPPQSIAPLPLRLVPMRPSLDTLATLWVRPGTGAAEVLALANELPSELLGQLQLARLHHGEQSLCVLRWSGSAVPPVLSAAGWQEFVPYLRLIGLYVPKGFGLQPPIRRDRLRDRFGLSANSISWLMPTGAGQFQPMRLELGQFVPLSSHLEYACAAARPLLVRPIEPLATVEPFVQREESVPRPRPLLLEEDQTKPPASAGHRSWWQRLASLWQRAKPAEEPRQPPVVRADVAELTRPTAPAVAVPAAATPSPASSPAPDPTDLRGEWINRRNRLEARFNDATQPLSAEQRAQLWPELATVYIGLNNLSDARLCWVNSLWEQEKPMVAWAWNWLRCESAGLPATPAEQRLTTWLDCEPTPQVVRSVAAYIVWLSLHENPASAATTELTAVIGRVQALLETHEAKLPVRVAWLAQKALAYLTHGDALALARTRDRLLQRLHDRGLSMDLDIPSFLRFAGQGPGDRFPIVRDWLIRSRPLVHGWIARLASTAQHGPDSKLGVYGLQVERQRTQGYADLMLAWGLARLGEDTISRQWCAEVCSVVPADPVQRVLLEAFAYRIDEARSDRSTCGPLPVELLERIDRLRELERYAVNRLREHSRVLEPGELVNAFRSIVQSPSLSETLDARLWMLQSITERNRLLAEVERLLGMPAKPAEQIAITSSLLALSPRLSEALTLRLLEQAERLLIGTPDPATHALLLQRGIFAALHYNLSANVQQLVGRFAHLLAGQSGVQIRQWLLESGSEVKRRRLFLHLVSQSFRGLRRLGLRTESERLMTLLAEWVGRAEKEGERARPPTAGTFLLETLLHLAGGWFYAGRASQAEAVIDRARQLLYAPDADLPPIERTALARTYAACLSYAPARFAIGRLEELYTRLDCLHLTGSTNTHYTLAVLELVDTIVLAVVREDFSLGPAVRRWLDDDEYQVRRRMQQDLQALLTPPTTHA